MSSYVMINGQIQPAAEARLPALDRGFLYGDGVYETIAAKSGVIIDLGAHLERLRKSAAAHGFAVPWSDEVLRFEMEHLLSVEKPAYASIRLVVTRGVGGSLIPKEALAPAHYLFCDTVAFPELAPDAEGIKLRTRRHPAPPRGDVAKTNNYLPAISEGIKGLQEGFDDVLWLGADSEFLETGSANIFFLSREGDLVEIATPPVASGLLEGTVRARLIDLLTRSRIPVTERIVTMEELPRFDEAFVCSSIRLLRPVACIDKHRLHTTRKNATFWHLHRLYNSWLQKQVDDGVENASNRH